MKVAYLAPEFIPTWGGVGIYSKSLIKELCKYQELEVHVFTPYKGIDKEKILKQFDERINIHFIGKSKDDFIYNSFFQWNLFWQFPKYQEKYNFDIIHSVNLVHMPDIFLKFRAVNSKFLVTAHTTIEGQVSGFLKSNKNFFRMAPSEKGSLLFYPYIKLLQNLYLKKTKNMITVSNKFKEMFIKNGYSGRLKAIHNGIDFNYFDYKKVTLTQGYKKFPQLKNKKLVLFAGRLITQKGIKLFLRLVKEFEKSEYYFVIAGKGDLVNLNNLIKKYNINKEKIIFLGFLDTNDLRYVYRLSDIFVLPSYYENLPISLLEAMSMKCACIATDVGAVDEIINKNNGILIQSGDFNSLKDSFKRLINNPKERNSLSRNGHNFVLNNFSDKDMAKKTYDFYKEILK